MEKLASKWPRSPLKEAVAELLGALRRRIRRSKQVEPFQLQIEVPASGAELSLALYQSLGQRLEAGHQVSVLANGSVFDTVLREIARAESSIHIVIYIWDRGAISERIVRALTDRARAGVACRIVVDALGASGFDDTIRIPLERAGCEVRIFRPLGGKEKLARNHRKIMIFDGSRAITGGFGIRDNWLGDGVTDDSWRDTNVYFAGPTVAYAQLAFAENWQEAGGSLLPAPAFPVIASDGSARAAFVASTGAPLTRAERLIQLLIAAARRRVWLANAYLVPSPGIVNLLCEKAASGIDVRILTPGKRSDSKTSFTLQQAEYRPLLKCGARVWEYQPSMMHAKTLVIDDDLSLIGSINLDPLSLSKLEEGALVAEDRAVAEELSRQFIEDCGRSEELT